jgi:hypothetical protein
MKIGMQSRLSAIYGSSFALVLAACGAGERTTAGPAAVSRGGSGASMGFGAGALALAPIGALGSSGMGASAAPSGGFAGTPASAAGGGAVKPITTSAAGAPSAGAANPPPVGAAPGVGMTSPAVPVPAPSSGAAPAPNPGPTAPPPGGPISDYGAMGPLPTTTMDGSGPDGMYTLIKPMNLGENGFKHPIATWGNGITTTPALYPVLLSTIASHGFVIIASDNSSVTAQMMTDGLNWLIKQNDAGGMFEGKLDVTRAVSIGYSLGGGAAVDTGSHPAVITTVSFHGLPGASGALHGPLLLFTTTADGFVTKDSYVKPCYAASTTVPTIMATLTIPGYTSPDGQTASNADFTGHLYPVNDAGSERAPAIAWLRMWVYGDENAKQYFYGADCILCKDPWTDIQRKNAMW